VLPEILPLFGGGRTLGQWWEVTHAGVHHLGGRALLVQTAIALYAITRKTVIYAGRERSHSNLCVEARSRCDVQIHDVSKV